MRRDVGFYLEAPLDQVYQAYLAAATTAPFERDCKQEPWHTISFGVNMSFKYNMNGGACTIHFMPSGTGTAVNIRFSLAQGVGARYERYAEDLNKSVRRHLPVEIRPAGYVMDDFIKPENQLTPETFRRPILPAAPAPVYQAPAPVAPAPVYQPPMPAAPQVPYCANCRNPLTPGARFCAYCGMPVVAPAPRVCPNCHTPAQEGAAFCATCGTRL